LNQQVLFVVSIAAGVIFGFLISWMSTRADRVNIYARGKSDGEKERAQLEERIAAKDARVLEVQTERDAERQSVVQLREENAKLKASQSEMDARIAEAKTQAEEKAGLVQKLAEEKLAMVADTQQRLSDSFKALSAEVLQSNNQVFLDLAKTTLEKFQDGAKTDLESRQKAIDDLLKPIQESLQKVDANVIELEKNRAAAYAGLTEQVSSLYTAQTQLRTETVGLVNALRAPSVRGRWGEVQLRRVVELAGMVEHCDFEQQQAVETDDGTLRPDMMVRLPNRRLVVIDAKVSLKAYLEALEATDEAGRQAKLKEHAAQVRSHITRLSAKKYWSQFAEAPEFVVAFLPGETFFSAALEQDPSLLEFGAESKVILSTPTTLIALLKAVAYGWQGQRLADNAKQVSELGQTLHDRLAMFAGYMDDVRRNLSRTVESYNKATGSLESRVMVSARRFRELGGAGGDEIPLLEGVDAMPRGLQALEQVTLAFPELDASLKLDASLEADPMPERVQAAG